MKQALITDLSQRSGLCMVNKSLRLLIGIFAEVNKVN